MSMQNLVSKFAVASVLSVLAGVSAGCVTTPVKPIMTLKMLPPDRCLAPYGKQARETMSTAGSSCVIWFNNAEMKRAERKYATSLASLTKQKLAGPQKKLKTDQLMALWFSEAGKAATKASCPKGMRKAADFPASAVTCTAYLDSETIVK
ncbi:hypothetical protein BH10BDE1_BH10BDE1_26660 [soil metagenome]